MRWFFFIFFMSIGNAYAQQHQPLKVSQVLHTSKIYLKYNGQRDSLLIPIPTKQYPQLKAMLSDTSLFFGDRLDSVVHRYTTEGTGITSLEYKVVYLTDKLISIKLYYETMGAYPDTYQRWLTLDMHTGKPYNLSVELSSVGLNWLFKSYKNSYLRVLNHSLQQKHFEEDEKETLIFLKKEFKTLKPNNILNNYVLTPKGIIFTSDSQAPHATRSFEPDRDWFVSYQQLRPYKLPTASLLQ